MRIAFSGLVGLVAVYLILLAGGTTILEAGTEWRTDPTTEAGKICTTGPGATTCSFTLAQVHELSTTAQMTVTETSPGSGDLTADATLGENRQTVTLSNRSPSTTYTVTVEYLVIGTGVTPAVNSILRALPLYVGIGTFLAITLGALMAGAFIRI